MQINSLSQLKKALVKGATFQVVKHGLHPEWAEQIRVVNVVQSNCVYTQILNQPDQPVSKVNGGRGTRMDFSAAVNYRFEGDLISWFDRPAVSPDSRLVMTFRVY
jgi:hypothetical protein